MHPCQCGCGAPVYARSTFRKGHNPRLKPLQVKVLGTLRPAPAHLTGIAASVNATVLGIKSTLSRLKARGLAVNVGAGMWKAQ